MLKYQGQLAAGTTGKEDITKLEMGVPGSGQGRRKAPIRWYQQQVAWL